MAHYQYEGLHFELPDGLSNEDAIKKIQTHLGKAPSSGAIPGAEDEAARVAAEKAKPKPTLGDKAIGVGEAALSTLTGLGAGIQAPVAGLLKSVLGMVPDAEKETARLMEQQTYKPRTPVGQDYAENVGKVVNDVLAPLGPGNLTGLAQSRPIGRIPRAPEPPVAPPVAKPTVMPPAGAAPDGMPMAVQGDLFRKQAQQTDLPFSTSVETIADQQRQRAPGDLSNQLDLFGDNSGGQRAAFDAEGIKLKEESATAVKAAQEAQTSAEHAAALERYQVAEKALAERQRVLEEDVARQTSLDQNAAQRAKQEKAPTGYEAWVEQQRLDAEQRRPGNNTPLDFESPYPVDAQQFPQVLEDAPKAQEGLPFDQPMLDQSLPVEVRDALGDSTVPDPFNRYSPTQAANRILREGEQPPILKTRDARTSLRSQRGGIDPDLLTFGIPKATKYLKEKFGTDVAGTLEKTASVFGNTKEPVAAYLERLPGLRDQADRFITKPKNAAEVLESAKAQGDGPDLATNWQSGLTMAAQKGNSVMLKNMAEWFNWSQNRANYLIRESVVPLETRLTKLGKDLTSLHGVMQEEMFGRATYSLEQLQEMGLSQKAIDGYQALRKTFDMFYAEQNAAREKLGKSPMTQQEAYMASVFRGDYHLPIYDKTGGLRFYIQTTSRKQAKAAISWLQKEFADNPNFDFSKLRYDHSTMYKPGGKFGDVPRDVMSSWKDIVEAMGDDPLAAEIKVAMENWVSAKGAQAFKQNLHQVDKKINVRGFEGDQPWLSAGDNAHNWAQAQVDYLKQAARWSAAQEAIGNAKEFLTDPDILQNQPNNVALGKAYMYNHMGITNNLMKNLESSFMGSMGLSRESLTTASAVLRSGLYIKTLAFSPGYIVATPIQALHGSLAWYLKEAKAGNVKGNLGTFTRSIFDAMSDERINKATDFNSQALKWADDNGVIKNIVYEDDRSLGSHPVADAAQKMSDWSIGVPDRFARRMVFLPFANALWQSGKYATKDAAFARAGEITDAVAVSMRPQDRPLIVQKLGQLGTMGYVFHAPVLNMYNHLGVLGREARNNGNYTPLLGYLGAMLAIGGIWNLPGIGEMEKLWEGTKSLVADHMPNQYNKIKDINPRLAVLKSLPEINVMGQTGGELLSYGGASAALGTDMRGRFSNEIINGEDPVGSMLPATSVYGDMLGSAAKAMTNPNAVTGTQLAKDLAPGGLARGMLETNNDRFKAPAQPYEDQGITSFRKPSDISDPSIQVHRNESEVNSRRIGVTALSEAKRREKDAIAMKEDMRLKTARKGVFDSMFKAIVNKTGDENTVKDAVRKYYALDGNPQDIQRQLETKFADLPFTRQQLQMMKAKRYEQIMSVVRRMEMDKQ